MTVPETCPTCRAVGEEGRVPHQAWCPLLLNVPGDAFAEQLALESVDLA